MKIAIDVETTGLEPGSRMIELAAIAFDENGVIDQFNQLVNPGMPLPKDALAINQITDDMLADKPDAGEVLRQFFAWLPCTELIAHFACYDTGIISWEAGRFGIDIPEGLTVIDTCEIAKTIGETKNNKLVTLADHYALERHGEDHRALADAHLCMEYFKLLHTRIDLKSLPWASVGHDYSYSAELPSHLSDLPDRIAAATQLDFTYQDAKGDITERAITPYGFAMTPKGLMFHGYCHMREARRSFFVDRMVVNHEVSLT